MNLMSNRQHILEICTVLSEQENLKVTLEEAGKGAVMVGVCAFLGGLLGGPVGIAVGGSVSSVAVACTANKYKSVVDILRNELTPLQKQKLINAVGKILNNLGPQDFLSLLTFIVSKTSLKQTVLKEMGKFLLSELNYKMI